MKKIGLVGGISWVSTLDYYRYLNEGVNAALGGFNFAECLIYSINFEDFQRHNNAGEWEASYALLLRACESLQAGGAEAIVLGANTAHVHADRLAAAVPLPLIHVAVATADAIKAKGLRRVGLIGTRFTMEMDFYFDKLREHGVEAFAPPAKATRDYIQQTVKDELGRGILLPETRQAYIRIMEEMVAAGAEGIILGCTEIPLLIKQADVTMPVFDTTLIHAQAAVDFALGKNGTSLV